MAIYSRHRALVFLLAGPVIVVTSAIALHADPQPTISEDRDLKELDLTAWNCVNRAKGSGRSPVTAERNRLKNRWTADLAALAMKSFDTAGFLKHVGDFDAETKSK